MSRNILSRHHRIFYNSVLCHKSYFKILNSDKTQTNMKCFQREITHSPTHLLFWKSISQHKEGREKTMSERFYWRELYQIITSSVLLNHKRSKRNALDTPKTLTAKYNLQRNCLKHLKKQMISHAALKGNKILSRWQDTVNPK